MAQRQNHTAENCTFEECSRHETCSYCGVMTDLSQLRPDPKSDWAQFVCPKCRGK